MLYLLRSWLDSLAIFLPKNIVLFLLVTFKLLYSFYKRILLSWLFLVLLFSVILAVIKPSCVPLLWATPLTVVRSPWFLVLVWAFFLYATLRPSISLKNVAYYVSYWRHFIWFILGWVLFISIEFGITKSLIVYTPYRLYFSYIGSLFAPFFAFYTLFLLDTAGGLLSPLYSGLRSATMVAYNLPFCLLSWAFFKYTGMGLYELINMMPISVAVENYLMLLVLPIPIAFYTQFYTKRLHDQFQVYVPSSTLS